MTNAANSYAASMTNAANSLASNLTNTSHTYASNQNNSTNSLLANLLNIYGGNQQNLMENSRIKYGVDAGNASAVSKTTGQAASNLFDSLSSSPLGKELSGLLNKAGGAGYDFIKSLFGGSDSGTGLSSSPSSGDSFYWDEAQAKWVANYGLSDANPDYGIDPYARGGSGLTNPDASNHTNWWNPVSLTGDQMPEDYGITPNYSLSPAADPWKAWVDTSP
jgi:hypothetical protein